MSLVEIVEICDWSRDVADIPPTEVRGARAVVGSRLYVEVLGLATEHKELEDHSQ